MNYIQQIERLQKLNKLIEQGRTGTPSELATRLGIGRRTLYDLLEAIKSLGVEIAYDRKVKTFHYLTSDKMELNFSLKVLKEGKTKKIHGGTIGFVLPCIFSARSGDTLLLPKSWNEFSSA